MIQQKKISQQIAESKTESTYLPKVKTSNQTPPILRASKILTKKIGVNDLMKKTLGAKGNSIFMSARPFARKFRWDGAVTETHITEETLPHLPIPTFGGADALNDAGGFEVGKMLLDGFGRDAYLCCKSNGTQLAIFGKQSTIFSLLF